MILFRVVIKKRRTVHLSTLQLLENSFRILGRCNLAWKRKYSLLICWVPTLSETSYSFELLISGTRSTFGKMLSFINSYNTFSKNSLLKDWKDFCMPINRRLNSSYVSYIHRNIRLSSDILVLRCWRMYWFVHYINYNYNDWLVTLFIFIWRKIVRRVHDDQVLWNIIIVSARWSSCSEPLFTIKDVKLQN